MAPRVSQAPRRVPLALERGRAARSQPWHGGLTAMAGRGYEERQELTLAEAARSLLDECRMILPGIQALFGFQLIAVFSSRFAEDLSGSQQALHLLAIALVVVATALIMTPAAYHRAAGVREVTSRFLEVSAFLLLASMAPLAAALTIDFYLIASLTLGDASRAGVLAALLAALIIFLWAIFPHLRNVQRTIRRPDPSM